MIKTVIFPKTDKIAYGVRELSKAVGICERKLREEIKTGRLKVARVGTRVIIPSEEVEAWLQRAL